MSRALTCLVVLFGISGGAGVAKGQSLIPGPGDAGHDAALAAKAEAFVLQQQSLISVPLGFGLEAFVDDPGNRAAIDGFFAAGATDFEAHTGLHPYEALSRYGEHGDLGMFGGVQAAGDAFRYAVLRGSGAPAAEVDAARDVLLRAMDGLHWQTQVTGVPGVIARGIRRATPEAGDPPLPGTLPPTLPLFDAMGNPQPAEKEPTWRDDESGELPFLIWLDDNSKDQIDGYIYALGAIYDVAVDDPAIPRDRLDRLVADALAIGRSLLESVEVAPGVEADLVIQDADGRPTTFHDLSAEEVTAGGVLPGRPAINGFNALMSMGIMRTIFHITGDDAVGRFYYEEMVGRRDYLSSIEMSVSVMYFGEQTNYSNVNMAFVAAYGVLRYETDGTVAPRIRAILQDHLWAPGRDREANGLGQAFFDVIYAGFHSGDRALGTTAIAEGLANLAEFPDPPYWNPLVENCDPAEITAGSCTAIDGTTTIVLAPDLGRGDSVVALEPLAKRLRPPTNFEWRSDPHAVNGGGGSRLNPGGGFHAAYWMGRFLEEGSTGFDNVSDSARDPLPWTPTRPDAGPGSDGGADADVGADAGDAGTTPPSDDGCGCSSAPDRSHASNLLFALVALLFVRRRR